MGFAKYWLPRLEGRILDIGGPRWVKKKTRGGQQPTGRYLVLAPGGYTAKGQDREYQDFVCRRWGSTPISNFQCPKE
jgi:hypothetical protein